MSSLFKHDFVFQTDSELVNSVYTDHDNYLIENTPTPNRSGEKICAIYFSSNNIYYPNEEEVFDRHILKENRFEWYGTRIEKASKHIFMRDVHKQWYLTGINSKITDPAKMLEFLKQVTEGFKTVTIGSSSGGFAAVLFGQGLDAKQIYTFNGQFEVDSLLEKSSQSVDPIIFRKQHDQSLRPYYDVKKFIKDPLKIYYFRSNKSDWDVEQFDHIKELGLNCFSFNTGHHGIPFAKTALSKLINMDVKELDRFKDKKLHPLLFSVQIAGMKQTFKAVLPVLKKLLRL